MRWWQLIMLSILLLILCSHFSPKTSSLMTSPLETISNDQHNAKKRKRHKLFRNSLMTERQAYQKGYMYKMMQVPLGWQQNLREEAKGSITVLLHGRMDHTVHGYHNSRHPSSSDMSEQSTSQSQRHVAGKHRPMSHENMVPGQVPFWPSAQRVMYGGIITITPQTSQKDTYAKRILLQAKTHSSAVFNTTAISATEDNY